MGDLRAVATIGALTTADTADLRAVATGGFLTTDAGNSAQLTDTLGAGEALLIAKSGDADNAEGAGFSESLTVTAGYKVSLADGLGGGEALASVRHGIPVALSTQTLLSDVAQMADGTVWIGRYSSEGIDAPLLRVESYTQSYVGLCGDRAVYETTAQVTEQAGAATGRGILSLHPDGYALAHTAAGNLQLWRYAAGGWGVLTETEAETVSIYAKPLGVGTYRLEVIQGGLYVLPLNDYDYRGFWLRGSVLWQLPVAESQAALSLPRTVQQYLSMIYANSDGQQAHVYHNCPFATYWRGRWHWLSRPQLRRMDDEDWRIPFDHPIGATLNAAGALTVLSTSGNLSYYGSRLQRRAFGLDLYAARATGIAIWCLGASSTLFAIGALTERVCILSATLEWAQARAVPNVLAATLEWSTGAGSSKPSVTAATLEWADGTGTNRPTLTAATLEWSSDLRPSLLSATLEWAEDHARAALTAATLEWSTGAGTERPSVTAATLEWSAAAGSSKPTVTSATLEWAEQPVTPYLLEATLEWAQAVTTSETVGVCWLTQATPGALVNAVRLTEVALNSGYTWIVRTDDAAPVEAYGSYTELTPYVLTEVPPGSMVRLGVIGPLADPVPAAILQLYCEPTAI